MVARVLKHYIILYYITMVLQLALYAYTATSWQALLLVYLGRIFNRFSKDMGYLDDILPSTFYDYLTVSDFPFDFVIAFIN